MMRLITKNREWQLFFVAIFILFYFIPIMPNLSAASGKSVGFSKIKITSDSLIVNNKGRSAIFSGHVIVIKGDLKILSDILHVVYTKKNKINMLIATGNVHIIKGKSNITGGKAVYYNKDRIAVITKNPIAYENNNKIIGKQIVINFKTGVSTIFGGLKNRVNATIYSGKHLAVNPSDKTLNKNDK